MKHILIMFFLAAMLVSCGKKADPEYKESNYKYINQKNII